MMFAQVQNGVVISEMSGLPECHGNVSGFAHADSATQIAHGFFPLIETKDVFNPDTEKLPAIPVYTISASQVTATYTKVALSVAELAAKLEQEKINQLALIESAYQSANTQPIAYMGTTFQADATSQSLMAAVLTASGGSLPAEFAWFDINNLPVTMTYAHLQGLAGTILMRGQPLFVHKQTQKALIRAATDVSTVQGVTW